MKKKPITTYLALRASEEKELQPPRTSFSPLLPQVAPLHVASAASSELLRFFQEEVGCSWRAALFWNICQRATFFRIW
jgi:hypothetical protein